MGTITQINANRWLVSTTVGPNTVVMYLDSSIPNGMGALHSQVIALINSDVDKLNRLYQLLESNSNFAFVWFCTENSFVLPPDEPPTE